MRTFLPLIVVATTWLVGCSASEQPNAAPSASAQPLSAAADASYAQCLALRNRERSCTQQYIPALVDARIEMDRPQGIAAQAKTEGRDSLIAQAFKEWEVDSVNAEEFCRGQLSRLPSPAVEVFLKGAGACIERSSCTQFVSCWVPQLKATVLR